MDSLAEKVFELKFSPGCEGWLQIHLDGREDLKEPAANLFTISYLRIVCKTLSNVACCLIKYKCMYVLLDKPLDFRAEWPPRPEWW